MSRRRAARGFSLLELMCALIVLTVGILAVGRLFPSGEHAQSLDRPQATAADLAQREIERLSGLERNDTALTAGRHPAGAAIERCGTGGRWGRWYEVETMSEPMSELEKVTVHVSWDGAGGRAVSLSSYVRR